MTDHEYTVTVTARTRDEADRVMAERLQPDEDYGFPYRVTYAPAELQEAPPA